MHDTKEVMAMKYAFVTNRARRAISGARAGRQVPPDASESLALTAKLLLEMRRGTAFIVGSADNTLGYSAESIPAATRALSVIETLALASRVSEVHELLESFENNLRALATQSSMPEPAQLGRLELFIRALNQSLTDEVGRSLSYH
jgi:hypothetical protein